MRLQRTVHAQVSMTLTHAVDEFILHQKSARHSAYTVAHYQNSLRHLNTFLATRGVSEISQVDPRMLREFVIELQDRFKPKTASGVASDIRAFFRFHFEEENIGVNPMAKVQMPKLDKLILPAFDKEEIQKLMKATDGRDPLSLRNRALILTLLDSGVRLTELASLKVGDVDLKTGMFKVLGKGGKERVCRISPLTIKALTKYMKVRQGEHNEPLWCGTRGCLTRFGVAEVIERIGKDAGVHAHPHKFRRTCALTMLRNGADIFSVQYLLGHSDLTVLRKYLAQTQTDYLQAHEKHSPVNALC